MANIPIRDIPGAVVASPDPSNLIPMDNGSIMQKTTIANAVNTTLPLSSQAEAEAGADNAKRMSPLRTKQAIDAQTPAIVNAAITALNLGTMSQEAASDYTKTSGLAAVALSNDYNDLDNLPTLGTAAATDASDYATAAQGALADTAVQPGNAALVPSGGTIGQVLVKNSGTNYDTGWVSSAAATAVSYAPQTLTDAQAGQAIANIGGGALAGFRNKIINPLFSINQRVVSGTVTLSAGQYGHDRFKAGASGCTYTFSTSNGVTTISISSGSLMQVIEAGAFAGQAGDYVLSWSGTAQGRIDNGSYGASGAVSAACDGSANVTVEFGTGTVSLAQFERGYVTDFSPRHIQQELALCQRYFQKPAKDADSIFIWNFYSSGVVLYHRPMFLPAPMRATPTVNVGSGWTMTNSSGMTFTATREVVRMNVSASGVGNVLVQNNTGTAKLELDAEL